MSPINSWLDVKLGIRMMVKHPGLTTVGVLGIAAAITIGASVFSVLSALFDRPLPLSEGARVVSIQTWNVTRGAPEGGTQLRDLERWRRELPALAELGAYRTVDRNLITADGRTEPLRIAEMTASGFGIARVPPLLGRYLVPGDERPGAAPVVVIGQEVWTARFGGDAGVIGRNIRLGAADYTVVGVMPAGFAFPVSHRVWTALRLDPAQYPPGQAPPVEVFGRLAPRATLAQAQAQLATLGRRQSAAEPAVYGQLRPAVLPYTRAVFGSARPPLQYYLFQLLVTVLLVVIAVNVAILVYARTATRTGEIAVRLALGARRRRVVGQLFAEALVLCASAAVVGLVAARFVLRQVDVLVSRLRGPDVPFWWDFRLSAGTVAYVMGLTVLAALIVGVVPALKVTRREIQPQLRQIGGMRMGRTWTALIVVQVAVAVTIVPLVLALGWNQFFRSAVTRPGFAADELLAAHVAMDVDPEAGAEASRAELARRLVSRQAELVRRLEAEPGVIGVTYGSHLPGDWLAYSGVPGFVEAAHPAPDAGQRQVRFLEVDPGLFPVFGVPLLTGRGLGSADLDANATAVVVNRSFVDEVLGGGAGVGERIRYTRTEGDQLPGGRGSDAWYEVVGVVPDFPAKRTVTGKGLPTLYHPLALGRTNPIGLVVRVRGTTPEGFAGRLREIAARVDPTLRLSRVESLGQLQRQKLRSEGMLTLAIILVTLSVLLLSAAGIHALMSFTIAQRRREIGIRAALGGPPRRILRSIFARSLRQLAMGVAVGSVLAGGLMWGQGFAAGRTVLLLLALAAVMLTVGLLAALGPARRGLAIEPTEALRGEG